TAPRPCRKKRTLQAVTPDVRILNATCDQAGDYSGLPVPHSRNKALPHRPDPRARNCRPGPLAIACRPATPSPESRAPRALPAATRATAQSPRPTRRRGRRTPDMSVKIKTPEEIEKMRIAGRLGAEVDRKSTRLNSSHVKISYAVFC